MADQKTVIERLIHKGWQVLGYSVGGAAELQHTRRAASGRPVWALVQPDGSVVGDEAQADMR